METSVRCWAKNLHLVFGWLCDLIWRFFRCYQIIQKIKCAFGCTWKPCRWPSTSDQVCYLLCMSSSALAPAIHFPFFEVLKSSRSAHNEGSDRSVTTTTKTTTTASHKSSSVRENLWGCRWKCTVIQPVRIFATLTLQCSVVGACALMQVSINWSALLEE